MEEVTFDRDKTFRIEVHEIPAEELLRLQSWEYHFRQLVLALNPEEMKTQLEEVSDA